MPKKATEIATFRRAVPTHFGSTNKVFTRSPNNPIYFETWTLYFTLCCWCFAHTVLPLLFAHLLCPKHILTLTPTLDVSIMRRHMFGPCLPQDNCALIWHHFAHESRWCLDMCLPMYINKYRDKAAARCQSNHHSSSQPSSKNAPQSLILPF